MGFWRPTFVGWWFFTTQLKNSIVKLDHETLWIGVKIIRYLKPPPIGQVDYGIYLGKSGLTISIAKQNYAS